MKKAIIIALFLVFLASCSDQPIPKGTYSVEYKQPDGWYWREIQNIKGDGIMFGENKQVVPVRYFILVDDSRIEMPMTYIFRFDPARCRMIEENIRRETGR